MYHARFTLSYMTCLQTFLNHRLMQLIFQQQFYNFPIPVRAKLSLVDRLELSSFWYRLFCLYLSEKSFTKNKPLTPIGQILVNLSIRIRWVSFQFRFNIESLASLISGRFIFIFLIKWINCPENVLTHARKFAYKVLRFKI